MRKILNVRVRPEDSEAIDRLRRDRGEGVTDLIRRLIHDADEARTRRIDRQPVEVRGV